MKNYIQTKLCVLRETGGGRGSLSLFEKPYKNAKVLLAESAINANSKRTILTQECLRRILNTKLELGNGETNEQLNRVMVKMKNAGYSMNYRTHILKMLEDDRNGTKPLYRNIEWNRENRMNEKEIIGTTGTMVKKHK